MPGLPPAAALYCMQKWTINFSHTQQQTPTLIVIHGYVCTSSQARLASKIALQKYSLNCTSWERSVFKKELRGAGGLKDSFMQREHPF